MSNSTDWDRAAAAVREHAQVLTTLTTHTELYQWATDNKFNTRTMWPKVRTEMRKQLGIDYNAIRERVTAERAATIAAAAKTAPLIELWSAGDAEVNSYAICDQTGTEAWYQEFYPKDSIYQPGDDLSAEQSAADKAIFLAGKAREERGLDTVRLLLHTCHPDLNAQMLAAPAARHRVALTIDVDDTSPAVDLCRAPGQQSWHEVRLSSLFVDESEGAAL